jgi:UDP-N-acetylglucosamine 1-carboxyvinyltransferase
MRRLLEDLGCTVLVPELRTHQINAGTVEDYEAPYELVKTMRASVLALGPLLGRFGQASVSLPGGCAIGQRPIDLHLMALEKMGAKIELRGGVVEASASRLRGADIEFETVTVTGTENVMMAAALADGVTRISNAACEPEIVDLAELLTKMGAKIEGACTQTITVTGVERLGGADHTIIPDRIETGTFIVAAAITGGELEITNCEPGHLRAVIEKLREVGVKIEQTGLDKLRVAGDGKSRELYKAADVTTAVYPGFPTDMQAQYMALMTQAEGDSVITETIFENRFMHAAELMRLGAQMRINSRSVDVHGPSPLTGAQLIASDLRASASLVLAGLAAEGETLIDRVYHIDRGYEKIEEKLRAVGAEIERVKT